MSCEPETAQNYIYQSWQESLVLQEAELEKFQTIWSNTRYAKLDAKRKC